MRHTNFALADKRRDEREQVHHRTVVATAAGDSLALLVVNISPNGLMARCDQPVEPGTPVTFRFPGLPALQAEVRWTLGGRIGCEFAATIPIDSYFAILPRLRG